MSRVLNFAAFQVAWFFAVGLAATGRPLWGALVVVPSVLLNLAMAKSRARALGFIVVVAVLGGLIDSLLGFFGFFRLIDEYAISYRHTIWFAALWANFATTPNLSLRWLREHTLLAAFGGLACGPLAVFAAWKMGAIQWPQGEAIGLAVAAIEYGLLFPCIARFAARLDGFADESDRG